MRARLGLKTLIEIKRSYFFRIWTLGTEKVWSCCGVALFKRPLKRKVFTLKKNKAQTFLSHENFEVHTKGNPSRGQVVVEYILLLMVGVIIATLITNFMVSRNSEEPGFLIKKWREIIRFIGEDYPDEIE